MSMSQFALLAFWVVVPSLIGALLLRAATASVNRFLKPQPPLTEPSFAFGFTTLVLANIGGAILFYFLPSTIPFAGKAAIAIFVQWSYVCFVLQGELQNSLAMALLVVTLQFVYSFVISLIFLIPYALFNY